MMQAVNLLRKLVEIPSPSGHEDEIMDFLTGLIGDLGFDAIIQENEVKNIVVNPEASVWVVTHMDTVPIKSEFRFDGVYAYGTGVCDAKGSIAAILLALEKIDRLNLGIALFSDEEENGRGSRLFVKEYNPENAIVMEPTSLKIANSHYGSLEVVVKIAGVSAHGSLPEYGDNAIEKAISFVDEIKRVGKFSIQEITGGSDEYVIPDFCKLRLDFVFPPDVKAAKLRDAIVQIAGKWNVEVEVVEEYDGFVDESPILEKALRNSGIEVEYGEMPSWTDAINLKNVGCNVVVWGPGELAYCHTERERIAIDEIVKAANVIVNLNEIAGST
jgi:acetylornithine deacetylase